MMCHFKLTFMAFAQLNSYKKEHSIYIITCPYGKIFFQKFFGVKTAIHMHLSTSDFTRYQAFISALSSP